MKTEELFNRPTLIKLKEENILSGNELSKKEIVIKLLHNSEYSKNFIASSVNTNIAYVHKLSKQIKTNQL